MIARMSRSQNFGEVRQHDKEVMDSLLHEIEAYAIYDSFRAFQQEHRTSKLKIYKNIQQSKYSAFEKPVSKAKKVWHIEKIDINKADTSQLKLLRGIGQVLSSRIIKYRNLLGGFVGKDQFREIYGLKDSVLAQMDTLTFVEETFVPNRLNVNELSDYQLSRHPYISKKLAQAIGAYRFQHGNFERIKDLNDIQLLDSLTLARIAPYISF